VEKQYTGIGIGVSELRKLKLLEEENRRLQFLVADLTLGKHILQEDHRKTNLKPAVQRTLAYRIIESYEVSASWTCRLMKLHRRTLVYKSQAKQYPELRLRLRDLAFTRIRFGYRRLTVTGTGLCGPSGIANGPDKPEASNPRPRGPMSAGAWISSRIGSRTNGTSTP
jgi:hypothetical protein